MFSKLSIKTKIIIFCIAAIVGIGIIVSVGIENRKNSKNYKFTENAQTQNVKSEEAQKAEKEALKKRQEEESIRQEKEKALEEKYKKSYDAFFNKKYSEAIKLSDEIIKEDDKFYKAYNIKGIAQCYINKYIDGMKNIDKSLELKSDYSYARFNKAVALELYEKHNEALEWYDKALELENYVWSYYGKASIYGKKGDVANTVKNLKIAMEMDSKVKEEVKNLNEKAFDKVRDSKEFQELLK